MYDINDVLLSHVISGAGPAIRTLRNSILQVSLYKEKNNKYADFIHLLESFFRARTDIRRLIYAQEVAEIILGTHDMQELTKIRKIVAELELSRIIEYKNHRDHTAHTLYLFLLGIWLYDTVPLIRESFTSKIQTQPNSKFAEWYIADLFILQWLYTGLLHDVGYVFSELNSNTKNEYRRKIDELFEFQWLESEVLKEFSDDNNRIIREALVDVHTKFTELYGEDKWPSKTSFAEHPREILKRISYMPWIRELGLTTDVEPDVFRLFNTPKRKADDLKSFADKVANKGYSKNGKGIVDHAVASGLLLLQYSTYWFWLMTNMKRTSPQAYNLTRALFADPSDYSLIVEACRAIAYHNIELSNKHEKFNIHEDPLLFLGVLCDELSTWDRFHASKNLSDIWSQRNFLESSDIILSLDPNIADAIACFKIQNDSFPVETITKALDKKLQDWNEIVRISKIDG